VELQRTIRNRASYDPRPPGACHHRRRQRPVASELGRLLQGAARNVLVNLGDVKQIDSSGISTLVRMYVSFRHSGASLKLLAPQAACARFFRSPVAQCNSHLSMTRPLHLPASARRLLQRNLSHSCDIN